MRALLVALLLAIVTAVPAFADDGGGDLRTPAATVDVGGPGTWAP
jgi:hypothetical protein